MWTDNPGEGQVSSAREAWYPNASWKFNSEPAGSRLVGGHGLLSVPYVPTRVASFGEAEGRLRCA